MALEMINDEMLAGIAGDSNAKTAWTCDSADLVDSVNALFNTAHGYLSNLVVKSVNVAPLKGDWSTGKAVLTANYAPYLSVDALLVDRPFKFRMEVASEAITIRGNYHWSSDSAPVLKRGVLPVKRFSLTRIVLFGMRSTFDLSTYESYADHVNSLPFLGGSEETVLFHSTRVEQKQLLDGTYVYAVELHLLYRPSGWNNFYREDKSAMDIMLDSNGDTVYPAADFSYLLL